ncbi:nucleoside deaminase [Hydrotalea sp.]|uniref:nucleoside deaminase n=1 Tax=Hydrotalea sp. TaxID=2881279 RepID=UPI0026263C2A|nr:nucleoside deaminase [Hydrotalea sp.]
MSALYYMREAIKTGMEGMRANHGGPFGCVIVKNGEIIARGYNKVLLLNDPTAHAEVTAIREACKVLNDFQLTDCEIYTTCEPCPMCMGAIYWARPKKVYYANTRNDAANIGFDDSFIYQELTLPVEQRKMVMECIGRDEALAMFEAWQQKDKKFLY